MQNFYRKSSRAFVAAWLVLALSAGCSLSTGTFRDGDSKPFEQIERSFRQGEYQRCLEQCEARIAQHPGGAFYDRALFYGGLSLVRLGSGAENHSRALHYFQMLNKECPESTLAQESAAWVQLLSRALQLEKELHDEQARTSVCLSDGNEKDRRIAGLSAEIGQLKKKLELFKKADLQFQQQKKDMQHAGKP
jgi:hypothetical protein